MEKVAKMGFELCPLSLSLPIEPLGQTRLFPEILKTFLSTAVVRSAIMNWVAMELRVEAHSNQWFSYTR